MDEHYGASLELVERVLGGTDPAYPAMPMPVVDVRDVARMHVAVLDHDTVGQRFPGNAGAITFFEVAQILRAAYPDRKISGRRLPDGLVRLLAKVMPDLRTVAGNLGRNLDVTARTPRERARLRLRAGPRRGARLRRLHCRANEGVSAADVLCT